MDISQASQLFGTLSSPLRFRIFQQLLAKGSVGIIAGDLAKQLNIAPNKLSFHLKALTAVGLVHNQQIGRCIHYYANLSLMMELVTFMTVNCCQESDDPECQFCHQ